MADGLRRNITPGRKQLTTTSQWDIQSSTSSPAPLSPHQWPYYTPSRTLPAFSELIPLSAGLHSLTRLRFRHPSLVGFPFPPLPFGAASRAGRRPSFFPRGGMDTTNRPQILEHIHKSLTITIYETKWIPSSARFVVLGGYARSTGCVQARAPRRSAS